MRALMWFRNDLRLHDHEALNALVQHGVHEAIYLVVDDERLQSPGPLGLVRCGPYRRRAIDEAIADLRQGLKALGCELTLAQGNPIELIPQICAQAGITEVFTSTLTAHDEKQDEEKLSEALRREGIKLHLFHVNTLLHPDDLEFDVFGSMSFSKRRGKIEPHWPVRAPLAAPKTLPPSIQHPLPAIRPRTCEPRQENVPDRSFPLAAGESASLARVHRYFWESDALSRYRETRNGLMNLDDSSKFSTALSLGSLSPRWIYSEVRRYEQERVKNDSTLWFIYEILWRDHFHFLARDRGSKLFCESGPGAREDHEAAFELWREARTGVPFVDAAMNELRTTGWLSNRMRQVAASALIHNFGGDWRHGAAYFESHLVDYDPCSNWGNWAYIAGADAAGKPHVFDLRQQAQFYDPAGEYTKRWTNLID